MIKSLLTLYVAVLVLVAATDDSIYCTFKCKKGKDTMCIYKEDVPGSGCKDFDSSHALTVAQKQEILDKHNEYRGQAARGEVPGHPAAKEMPALTWSSELDRLAKRWAYQCSFDHDPCRHTKDGEVAGQNIGQSSSTSHFRDDYMQRFQGMFEEYENYKPDAKNIFPKNHKKKVGHYTQMVWAKTLYMGCEQVGYRDGKFITALIVCVYSPAGNFHNEAIYEPLPSGQRGELGPPSPPRPGETGVPGDAPVGAPVAAPSVTQRSSVLALTAGVVIAVHSTYVTLAM